MASLIIKGQDMDTADANGVPIQFEMRVDGLTDDQVAAAAPLVMTKLHTDDKLIVCIIPIPDAAPGPSPA